MNSNNARRSLCTAHGSRLPLRAHQRDTFVLLQRSSGLIQKNERTNGCMRARTCGARMYEYWLRSGASSATPLVLDQRDARAAVGVVLKPLHHRRPAAPAACKVDHSVDLQHSEGNGEQWAAVASSDVSSERLRAEVTWQVDHAIRPARDGATGVSSLGPSCPLHKRSLRAETGVSPQWQVLGSFCFWPKRTLRWPPPRCREVITPCALRPPVRDSPIVSGLKGPPFQRSLRDVITRPRKPGRAQRRAKESKALGEDAAGWRQPGGAPAAAPRQLHPRAPPAACSGHALLWHAAAILRKLPAAGACNCQPFAAASSSSQCSAGAARCRAPHPAWLACTP